MPNKNVCVSLSLPSVPFAAFSDVIDVAEKLGVPFSVHVDDEIVPEPEFDPPIIPAPKEMPLTFDGEKVGIGYISEGGVMIGTLTKEFTDLFNGPTVVNNYSIRDVDNAG